MPGLPTRIAAPALSPRYCVPTENAWLSRERDDALQWHHYIDLFDANTGGEYRIGFTTAQDAQLSGQVYQDSNGNGIREQGEPPLGGVAVQLQGTALATGAAVAASAHTAADGSFHFAGVPPGLYSLAVAQLPGLPDGVSLAGSAGGIAATGVISGIQLGAGTDAQGYVFSKRRGAPGSGQQADLAIGLGRLSFFLIYKISYDLINKNQIYKVFT